MRHVSIAHAGMAAILGVAVAEVTTGTASALADVRASLDAVVPYGIIASPAGEAAPRARTLGLALDAGAELGVRVGESRLALGGGYFHVVNGTHTVSSEEGDVENLSVSPRLPFARLRYDHGAVFASFRYLVGGGEARVVQDGVGFTYALSGGRGFGVAAGASLALGKALRLRVPLCYDTLRFRKGTLRGVPVETPPHRAPWTWSGVSLGAGLEAAW